MGFSGCHIPEAPRRDSLTDPLCKNSRNTQVTLFRGMCLGRAAPTGPSGSHPRVVTPDSNKWGAGSSQGIFS